MCHFHAVAAEVRALPPMPPLDAAACGLADTAAALEAAALGEPNELRVVVVRAKGLMAMDEAGVFSSEVPRDDVAHKDCHF